MLSLNTKTKELYRVGPKLTNRLKKLGILNVRDFLFYFPVRYNDYSHLAKIVEIKINDQVVMKGKIISIENRFGKDRRRIITEALISDETGTIKVIWFGQPYLKRALSVGKIVILAGKVGYDRFSGGRALISPEYEIERKETFHTMRIVPIYPETKGISSKWLRAKIKPFLRIAQKVKDPLPKEILEDMDLIQLPEAIAQVHFPDFRSAFLEAKKRLSFDELFFPALFGLYQKGMLKKGRSPKIKFKKGETQEFVGELPFKLTDAQRKASWEIIRDLKGKKNVKYSFPMSRLLNGDVGSGKTIVAGIAALNVVMSGYRVVIMAPTEVLAYQHFKTFKGLFKNSQISVGLFTRSYKETKGSREPLLSDIIIGTQALIQKGVKLKNIGLVVVDEQHRFGVKQRAKLKMGKDTVPHLLTMTATPIPRTMSIALFSDLDVSILDEMPRERKKIVTKIVPPWKRSSAYEFIRKQVDSGKQIFVICPLIEESDVLGVKSATEEYKKLTKDVFPDLKIGLLHGKMKSDKKDKIMKDFSSGRLEILVSTSVVEVGVDVPKATVMMIEGAERFGLSQLHQFRGRVGRGKYKSFCFLFAGAWSEKIKTRLKTIAVTRDGFKIAKIDLKMRGPGEVFGTRQSGIPDLKMASYFDYKMVRVAREEAEKILKIDPTLKKWPDLLKKIKGFRKEYHLE